MDKRQNGNITCAKCGRKNCLRERMTREQGIGLICSGCYGQITNAERRALLGKPCGRKNRRPNAKSEALT